MKLIQIHVINGIFCIFFLIVRDKGVASMLCRCGSVDDARTLIRLFRELHITDIAKGTKGTQ